MADPRHPSSETLSRFVGGLLGSGEARALRAHLEGCAQCRGEVDTLRTMGLRTLPGGVNDEDAYARTTRPVTAEAVISSEELVPVLTDVLPGQAIGRYIVTETIGRGAMGLVLAARDPRLERKVAIKLLRPDLPIVESAALRARLMREAQSLAQLSHPNVVGVHDVGDFGGSVFLAMDYVEGQTLSAWLRERPRDWREVAQVFAMAGAGLAAAHKAGLVHRDFKPDNVLLGKDGVVRVTDFGLSRRVRRDESASGETITGAGSLIGTPAYMSPEQFDGKPLDERSDQFGFCVALYEALYGVRPYQGDTLRAFRDAVHAGPPLSPPPGRKVPAWLHALVLKGLSPRPEDRHPSLAPILASLVKPPRGRRLVISASVGAVALFALVAWLVAREVVRWRSDPCRHIEERADAVLKNEPVRAEIRAAYARTGMKFAVSAAAALDRSIDEFRRRWVADYRALCERPRSTSAEATRQACLDARLRSAKAMLESLQKVNIGIVSQAPTLRLVACGQEADIWTEPEDPALHPEFHSVRDQLAHGVALDMAHKPEEALPFVRAGLARARAQRFRVLEAWASFLEGALLDQLGRPNEALKSLEAAERAAEAGRADLILFYARVRLAEVLAFVDVARARQALDGVNRAAERTGLSESPIVYETSAAVLAAEGRAVAAVEQARKALGPRTEQPAERAIAHHRLSAYLVQANQIPEAIVEANKSLELLTALYGADSPTLARGYTSLATAYGRVNKNQEALEHSLHALALLAEVPGHEYQMVLFNTGLLYKRLKRFPEAEQALERAIALQPEGEIDASFAQMLAGFAELLQEIGKPERALPAAERAVAAKEKILGGESASMAAELSVLGSVYESLGRHDEAARVLERTLKLLEASGTRPVLTEVTRYELARSLWHAPATRDRAVGMVVSVRDYFKAKGPDYDDYTTEADDWLKAHPPLGKAKR